MQSWHFEGRAAEEMFRQEQREQEDREKKRAEKDKPFGLLARMKATGWEPGQQLPAVDAIEADYTIEAFTIPIAKPLEWLVKPLLGVVRAQWLGIEIVKQRISTAAGTEITGFAKHGLNRAIERGVKPYAILDAMKNPLKTGNIVTDPLGRQSQRFIGQFGEVVVNPQTGKIISVNPTSSRKAEKLLKQLKE